MAVVLEGIEALANAIITQAADDYRQAYLGYRVDGKSAESVMKETEHFFGSEYCDTLTTLDCKQIPRMIQKDEVQKAIDCYEAILDGSHFDVRITISRGKGQSALRYRVPPRFKNIFTILAHHEREKLVKKLEELNHV